MGGGGSHTLARATARGGRDKAAGQPDGRTEQTDRRARLVYNTFQRTVFRGPR